MNLTQEQRNAVDKAIEYALNDDDSKPYFIINGGNKSGKSYVFRALCDALHQTNKLYESLHDTRMAIHVCNMMPLSNKDLSPEDIKKYNNTNSETLRRVLQFTTTHASRTIYLVDNADALDLTTISPTHNRKVILFTTNNTQPDAVLTDCFSPFAKLLDNPPELKDLDTLNHPCISFVSRKEPNRHIKKRIFNDPRSTIHVCNRPYQKLKLKSSSKLLLGGIYEHHRDNYGYCILSKAYPLQDTPVIELSHHQTVQLTSLVFGDVGFFVYDTLKDSKSSLLKSTLIGNETILNKTPVLSLTFDELSGVGYEYVYVRRSHITSTDALRRLLGFTTKHLYIME